MNNVLNVKFVTPLGDEVRLTSKGSVKLIKRVKISHSFLHSVSNQFHIIILRFPI